MNTQKNNQDQIATTNQGDPNLDRGQGNEVNENAEKKKTRKQGEQRLSYPTTARKS